MKTIRMTRHEFFMRLSQGEIGAWSFEIEQCEDCIDGIVHCFGNEDVHIALTIGEDGIEYYSYWAEQGTVDVELLDISYN